VNKRSPHVVLVGRPNVGKSTLFNRITSSRRAIVTPVPGTTRDVITQPVVWRGIGFDLTDTGGMFGASEDPLHAMVLEAGRRAMQRAELVVFVVDGRDGKTPGDDDIAKALHTFGKPVILAVNKMDDRRARDGALGPYALQSAIAACHARAHTAAETDWARIAALYDALAQLAPSPIVELNRAVALSMAYGPAAGLEVVDSLTSEPLLKSYHRLPSVRGELLSKLGRFDEARAEFKRAAGLTHNMRERELLLERARTVGPN